MYLCLALYILLICICIPTPFFNNYIVFITIMWLICIIQIFIEPILTGFYLNTVSPIERNTASSMGIFLMFVIGYVPAPYTYGLVNEINPDIDPVTGNNMSRGGMKAILWSSVLGGLCLALAVMLKRRSLK